MDQTDLEARQTMRTMRMWTTLAVAAADGDVAVGRRLGSRRKQQRRRRKSKRQQGGDRKSAGDGRRG